MTEFENDMHGVNPEFKKVSYISTKDLTGILNKEECVVNTYFLQKVVQISDVDDTDFVESLYNFVSFNSSIPMTMDEIASKYNEIVVVLSYRGHDFVLQIHQYSFLKMNDKYKHVFTELPKRFCTYGIRYNTLRHQILGVSSVEMETYVDNANKKDSLSLYYELLFNHVLTTEDGATRFKKDSVNHFSLRNKHEVINLSTFFEMLIEQFHSKDMFSFEITGQKLPKLNQNDSVSKIKPIDNTSRIIKQMANLGRDDILTIDADYEDNTIEHDTLAHEFNGDATRIINTVPFFNDDVENFEINSIKDALISNVIIGHYCDVKAYMDKPRFKLILDKIEPPNNMSLSQCIVGLGNDMVAVFHMYINIKQLATEVYSERILMKDTEMNILISKYNSNDNIIKRFIKSGNMTLHFIDDLYLFFKNDTFHINEISDNLEQIGFVYNERFDFYNYIHENMNMILVDNTKKIKHPKIKELLLEQ